MIKTISLLGALALCGCASQGDYYRAVSRQIDQDAAVRIAQAGAESERWKAETARWQALADIGKSGDTTARVAATFALSRGGESAAVSNMAPGAAPRAAIAPPESWDDKALRWAGLLFPLASQLFGAQRSYQAQVVQSNNARDVAINQATATASMVTGGYQAVTSVTGALAGGWEHSVANGFAATRDVGVAGFNAFGAARPNQTFTLSGQGVIGNGSYTGPVTYTTTTTTNTTTRNCTGQGGHGAGTEGVPGAGGSVSINC